MSSSEVLVTAAAMFVVVLLVMDGVTDFLFIVIMGVLGAVAAVWAFLELCGESVRSALWRR